MNKVITSLMFFMVLTTSIFSQIFPNALKDSVIYLTPEEEAFMIDKESKYLFKLSPDGNSLTDIATNQSLSIAFEKKLLKAFSISLMADFPRSFELYNSANEIAKTLYWQGGIELRYYYQMPGLIKRNKHANNLSGSYFGANFKRGFYTGNDRWSSSRNNFLNITYGIQKRFLNRGFVDFSVSLGNTQFRENLHFSAGIKAGLALGENYQLSDDIVCPIFKCYTNRKSAFKINLLRRWTLNWTPSSPLFPFGDVWNVSISPNISHEIKIANSPLSFEQDLDASIFFSTFRLFPGFGINNYILKYHAGFRFYHGMRNRIKKGLAGNNLSGFYSFARTKLEQASSLRYDFAPETGVRFPYERISKEIEGQIGVGYQREVLERFYFDLGIGATKDIKRNLDLDLQGVRLASYLKVGLMF